MSFLCYAPQPCCLILILVVFHPNFAGIACDLVKAKLLKDMILTGWYFDSKMASTNKKARTS